MNKIYLSDFYYFGRILPSHHSPILSLPLTLAFALPPAHLTLSGSSTGSYVMLLTKKSAAALSFHPGWPADRGERASARPGAKARRKGGGWARISACRPCWSTAVAASWKHCAVPCMEACTLEGRGEREPVGLEVWNFYPFYLPTRRIKVSLFVFPQHQQPNDNKIIR